jgi:DNA invertase Pin-like site-specific DNA recombinase
LVAYLRVSSEGQLDGYGLDAQRRTVRAWAKANGHRIVHTCVDEATSGALEAADRPGLACALDANTTGVADGVVVARLGRLARQLTVQEATRALVWQHGARVFAVDTGESIETIPTTRCEPRFVKSWASSLSSTARWSRSA